MNFISDARNRHTSRSQGKERQRQKKKEIFRLFHLHFRRRHKSFTHPLALRFLASLMKTRFICIRVQTDKFIPTEDEAIGRKLYLAEFSRRCLLKLDKKSLILP